MKKFLINILVICLVFSSVGAGAAYTVSGTTVLQVPLFTTAEELCSNTSSIPDGEVVVKSVDSQYDTAIYKKSFVDESCFLKSGNTYYSIDTIDPFQKAELTSAAAYNITDMMARGTNLVVAFVITPDESFCKQTVYVRISGVKTVSFEIGNDSFASIADGTANKVRLERTGTDRPVFAELFWKRSSDALSLEYVCINGEKITLANAPQLPVGEKLLVGYESEDSTHKLTNLNVMCVSAYETQYKDAGLSITGSNSNIYKNYGVNNVDAVYLYQNSTDTLDAAFGSEIIAENDKLSVNNLLSGDTYECALLDKAPKISKVKLLKNGTEIFALESGDITVTRDIPANNIVFMARYDSNNILKQISGEKSVTFSCESGDTIKVFVLESDVTLLPVTVAAQISNKGIFQNDGYEK